MNKFGEGSNDFAFALFNQVSKDGENSFLSPASISLALAMTCAGAAGNTKHQMETVLFGAVPAIEVHENLSQLVKVINQSNKEFQLDIANRIYCEQTYKVLQSFVDVLHKYYESDCVSVDFAGKAEEIRKQINSWVEEVTKSKIKYLLPDGVLSGNTKLVLVNAIYFKGEWQKTFDEKQTVKQAFHVSDGKTVEVDMMHAKHKLFKYVSNDDCQVLGIPYKGGETGLTMYFVLPTERFGLNKLVKKMKGSEFVHLISGMRSGEVKVELPKFKMEKGFDLIPAFKALGMTDMFVNADFSAISGRKDLSVTGIFHNAFIEVNEQGAEAAGATAVVMAPRCMPKPPTHFVADQPFLFAIIEELTKSLLFLGHFYG